MINKKVILTGFVILIAALFLLAPAGSSLHPLPETSSTTNYQPDPTMNTNITWDTYNSSWAPLEYNNGTGYQNLTAGYSSFYANPISINPGDIKPYTLNGKYAGVNFFNGSQYLGYYPVNNHAIGNNSNGLYLEGNASSTTSLYDHEVVKIPWAQMPSQNYKYIYISATLSLSSNSGNATIGAITVANSTQSGAYNDYTLSKEQIHAGQTMYLSESLAQIIGGTGININSTASPDVYIGIYLGQPSGPATDTPIAKLTLSNFAVTTYPILLGQNSTGSIISSGINEIHLTKFAPTVPMVIQNNGYSVAVSASPLNLSEIQTPITSGNYIEQVQYSGTFQLPSAPDLSFGNANITFPLTVPADQVQVLTLAGTSYINTLGNKTNGTIEVVSSVNPTSSTSYYAIVDYTASQWNQISHPAGFFTFDGISYYFFIAIGAIAGILGLAGAVRHAHIKADQERKVDNMPRRGR